jgi:hypothetical protein
MSRLNAKSRLKQAVVFLEQLILCSFGAYFYAPDSALAGEHAASAAMEIALVSDEALKEGVGDCMNPPDPSDSATPSLTVNGHRLSAAQSANVNWIARCVVPMLPGTVAEQAHAAALSTWWSLREGILDIPGMKAFRYSNCHELDGHDHTRSNQALYNCPTSIWQVGIAAGQVANYTLTQMRAVESRVFGTLDSRIQENSILGWSASLAGFRPGSATHEAIRQSSGRVRRSWLMRNPVIGMLLVGPQEVTSECFIDKKRWCFNGDYPDAVHFSHTVAGMRQSIADLETQFKARN